MSAAFHDEPTIEALNLLGLDVSAVGNHEFDEGVDELLRIQEGGCHPTDGCQTGHDYAGADFQFLAANVVYKDTGETILPATTVKTVGGVKVGLHRPDAGGHAEHRQRQRHPDVNFLDEATTINAATAALRSQGVKTIVVLLHEGGRAVGEPQSEHDRHVHRHVRRDRRHRVQPGCPGRHGHQRAHPQRLQLPAARTARDR